MARMPAKSSVVENRNSSDPRAVSVPILEGESELKGIGARLRSLFEQKESQRSFARRVGISEAALRDYISETSPPGGEALSKIATTTGVLVDWLASGRLPKFRREMPSNVEPVAIAMVSDKMDRDQTMRTAHRINDDILRMCLSACIAVYGESFSLATGSVQLPYVTVLYNHFAQLAASYAGNTVLEDFIRLRPEEVEGQLRLCLKMGWARQFPVEGKGWSSFNTPITF